MTVWTVLLLALGIFLLIKGADFFVDGASSIAKVLKIPSLIIGLTLVSIGTSLPEASVSITSALQGLNDMSIGNVVGSNILNTLFILGLSAILIPLVIDKDMKKFDIPIMCFLYVILILFAFVITPGSLDRWEGVVLLVLLVLYLIFLVLRAKKSGAVDIRDEIPTKNKPIWLSLILIVLGGAGIIFGGTLVVDNASIIATSLGMSQSLVGLTIVSIGTSLPELVTSIIAAMKKENDIAIGNVVGSNIFNVIFILGMSATISPLVVISQTLVDILVMIFTAILTLVIAFSSKKVNKWHGLAMVVLYVAYLAYIIARNYIIL